MDTFKNRLIAALQKKGMKAADLCRKTGISSARMSQYVNGVYEAKQDTLYKLAGALGVSEAWLMGFDIDPAPQHRDKASDCGVFRCPVIARDLP